MNETLIAILRQIIVEPDVDLHRLVYADALDERGEVGDAAQAKFIRGAIENVGRGWECYSHPTTYDVGFRPLPTGVDDFTIEFDRGFMKEWIVSAELFLKHADALLWHPTQVVKSYENCIHCGGRGSLGRTQCDRCEDGRRVVETPRPCPPTAQPIRKVVLTTIPGRWDHYEYDKWLLDIRGKQYALNSDERLFAPKKHLERAYPGVEFELPNAYTEYDAEDAGTATEQVLSGTPPSYK